MTGQSGLNKSGYLEESKKIFDEEKKSFRYETLGHKMIENYDGKIDERTILNLPKNLLDLLQSVTSKKLLEEFDYSKKEEDFLILNTHVIFRWHHGLFPTLDIDMVLKFEPDMIVCLIDTILNVKKGLKKRDTDFFNFWELFAWREEEIWLSKFMADSVGKLLGRNIPFFILPKAQGPKIFANLLIKSNLPKTYISFPITGITPEENKRNEEFKSEVKENFIAFDPLSIEDRNLTLAYYTEEEEIKEKYNKILQSIKTIKEPGKKWSPYIDEYTPLTLTKFEFSGIELIGRELLSVTETIDSQIISRDYMLIDQSDFLVMYIRADKEGEPRISAGCQSEMIYAYLNAKPVYVVFSGGEKKLSPWITQYSEVFNNVSECLAFILKEHKIKISR